jgi:hypothetical protein
VRRLRDFQIVGLEVSEAAATCRVVAVDGGQAVLEPRTGGALAEVALPAPATLTFDTARHPVLLAGAADAGPLDGTLRFWVTDDVGVPPVRLRPRLKAQLPVRVTPIDADGRRTAFGQDHATTDLSAGGVAVAGLDARPGDRFRVEIVVPGLVRTVSARAHVVRRTAGDVAALAFDMVDAEVADQLDQVIFAVRRRLARQAFGLQDAA